MKQLNFTTLALLSLVSLPSIAKEDKPYELTPLIGYRIGGEFDIKYEDREQGIKAEEATSYGLLFAFPFDKKRQSELLFSHYDTELSKTFGIIPTTNNDVDPGVSVSYLHIGGNVPISDGRFPVKFSGGLGFTHFSPDDSRLTSETQFSMNIGINKKFPITESISFRLGSRLYGTFFNSNSKMLCGTENCALYISGSVWVQAEANAGLTFAF